MIKCYDKVHDVFMPFAKLSQMKKTELASLMKATIDSLLEEMKAGKSTFDLMDVLMFKSGVKKKMTQVRMNELFRSAYRFLTEGLSWTTPNAILDEEADVVKIEIYPEYLPIGGEEDGLELVIGKGKKTTAPLSVKVYRFLAEKKVSKLVVQNTEFIVDVTFDNSLMIEVRVSIYSSYFFIRIMKNFGLLFEYSNIYFT
jgi:hypothetical protein